MVVPLKQASGKAHPQVIGSGDTTQVPGTLQVDSDIRGPDDGTGVTLGHVPSGASTGSAAQVISVTTGERDNLVVADGMVIYNTTESEWQFREDGAWRTFSSGGGATTLLTTTATAAQINAAWTASIHTVFLTAGTYDENGGGGMTSSITVPAGKALVGTHYSAVEDASQNGQVRLEWSTGVGLNAAVVLKEGASVRGVHAILTGGTATDAFGSDIGSTVYQTRECIDCHALGAWTKGFNFPDGASVSTASAATRLIGCVADGCVDGFELEQETNAADERTHAELRDCIARDCTGLGFRLQIRAGANADTHIYASVTYCQAINNGTFGFFFGGGGSGDFATSAGHIFIAFNYAEGNGDDGFAWSAWSGGTVICNRAIGNTGQGFDVPSGGGSTTNSKIGLFILNEARGNTGTDIDYQNGVLTTWTGRFLNFSSTQHGSGTVCVESGSITATELQNLINMDEIHTVLMTDMGTSGDAAISISTTFDIPDGKRLIGSSRANMDITSIPSSGQVRFTTTANTTVIRVNDGASVVGVQVDQEGTGGTGIGISLDGAQGVIEGCFARDFNIGIRIGTPGVRSSKIIDCKTTNCTTGFIQDASVTTEQKVVIEGCVAENGTTGFDIDGSSNGFVIVRFCTATQCSGDGFNQRTAWGNNSTASAGYVRIHGCTAFSVGAIGFDFDNFNHAGTIVTDCRANDCGTFGFQCALGAFTLSTGNTHRPFIANCVAGHCASGGFDVDGTWARGLLHEDGIGVGTVGGATDSMLRLISYFADIGLDATGTTTLYTGKTSENVIPTHVIITIRDYSIAGGNYTVDPAIRINGNVAGDIVPITTLTGLATSLVDHKGYAIPIQGLFEIIASGETIVFEVTTAASGGTNIDVDVQLWGYSILTP